MQCTIRTTKMVQKFRVRQWTHPQQNQYWWHTKTGVTILVCKIMVHCASEVRFFAIVNNLLCHQKHPLTSEFWVRKSEEAGEHWVPDSTSLSTLSRNSASPCLLATYVQNSSTWFGPTQSMSKRVHHTISVLPLNMLMEVYEMGRLHGQP